MEVEYSLYELFPQLIQGDKALISDFLKAHELRYEDDIDYACGLVDITGKIVAIGCCANNILKGFAIDETLRGNNLLGKIITHLVQNRFQKEIMHLFVFTKSLNASFFENSGFYLLVQTDEVAMLENNATGVARYIRSLNVKETEVSSNLKIGTIVMNCNPFTLGHRYLIEYAAARCDKLYIFIVEEDQSVFPFDVRYRLVKKGVADLENVSVFPSGPYIISRQTFPTYFLKKDTDMTKVYTKLDISLFAEKIADPLEITIRFVGEEPNCVVTRSYNDAMKSILPLYGISIVEIPRKLGVDDKAISASSVRKRLAEESVGEWLCEYVPEVTYTYLQSAEAKAVISKCK